MGETPTLLTCGICGGESRPIHHLTDCIDVLRARADAAEAALAKFRMVNPARADLIEALAAANTRAEKAEAALGQMRADFGHEQSMHFKAESAADRLLKEKEAALAAANARAEKAEQRACDFQAAAMIDVGNQGGPCAVEPRHVETHITELREALAAARRECEGLERLRARLDEDRSIGKALRVLVQILDGEPTGPGDKRLAAEALSTHMDLIALAAPADGCPTCGCTPTRGPGVPCTDSWHDLRAEMGS